MAIQEEEVGCMTNFWKGFEKAAGPIGRKIGRVMKTLKKHPRTVQRARNEMSEELLIRRNHAQALKRGIITPKSYWGEPVAKGKNTASVHLGKGKRGTNHYLTTGPVPHKGAPKNVKRETK